MIITYYPHFTLHSQKLLIDFCCRHNKMEYTVEASLEYDMTVTESKTGLG